MIRFCQRMLAGLALATQGAFALTVSMDVQPRLIQVGESATLTITIEGQGDAPAATLPEIPGFQVRSSGRQSSIQFINGRRSSSITYSYELIPTQAGTFSVGPFTFAAGGESVQLPPVEVQVGGGRNLDELLFATISADSTNIYHQQSFDLEISIYSRDLNLDGNVELVDMPTTGLRLQQFRPLGNARETVNNQVYDVRRYRCRATALTAGQFILAPILRVGIILQRQRHQDLFAFFGGIQSRPQDITARPLALNIQPLPVNGRPANFSGAVGHFTFDAHASPTEINAGDPVTLTITLAGEGNIDVVAPPQIAASEGFRIYEPKLTLNEVDLARGQGRKIFEQVVIPKTHGATNLTTLAFSYFDPEAGRYLTTTRGPFTLVIHPSSNDASRLVQGSANQTEPTKIFLGADIGYLKPGPGRWKQAGGPTWFTHPVFLGLQSLPPLAWALVFMAVRRRDELVRDVSKARRQQAPRAARSALAKAEKAVAAGRRRDYFEALWEALASYFGHRYNLAPGEVTRDSVLARLHNRLGSDRVEQLRAIFDRCEQERFGASDTADLSPDDRDLHRKLGDILRACEGSRP